MSPELHLLINNVGVTISGVAALGTMLYVYFSNPRRVVNITLALAFLMMAIFAFSHIAGSMVSDPKLSRAIFVLNLSVIFIAVFNAHCVLSVIGKVKERRLILYLIYILGFGMAAIFLIFPNTFLLDSVPKMYFPNYYVPGSLHWLFRVIFDIAIPIYITVELLLARRTAIDINEKKRYFYFALAEIFGWGAGFFPLPLIYNYNIDPAWGSLCLFFFVAPFVYASVQYELLDIKVIAKRAFWYAMAVVGIGGAIAVLELFNRHLIEEYPGFPIFIAPLVFAIIAVVVGVFIWKRLREGDLLKYEFVTVATHKFRTPLTHIRWAIDSLTESNLAPNQRAQIELIRDSSSKLVELTDLLVLVSKSEELSQSYNFACKDLASTAKEVLSTVRESAEKKRQKLIVHIVSDLYTTFDESRIKFVIGELLENAINYTPENQLITVSAYRSGSNIIFSVKDSGVGMAKNELALVFSKFYRSHEAKLADTEGVGVGLFLAKGIIARHQGKIWVESPGPGQGSAFAFSLPVLQSQV